MARGVSFQTAASQGVKKTIDYAVDAFQGTLEKQVQAVFHCFPNR